jgi:D-inositol-3-phosphate glycosyltransferase
VDSGGQNVYVGELARHLVEIGYSIDIFTRCDNAELPQVINWIPGVKVIHIKAGPSQFIEKEKLLPYMRDFTANMESFIKSNSETYRLVHANFWMSAMVAADIKRIFGIPFIVTFHALGFVRKLYQGDQDKFPPERLEIERQVVKDADHIIAECPQDKEDLMQYYHASAEKITIIPCGFNPHEFYPMDRLLARMFLKLDPSENIILQLGRMVPRKGVDNVIKAFAKTRRTGIAMRLLIVGGETDDADPEKDLEIGRLRKLAEEEGVSDAVTFTGRRNRALLRFYYAAADIFVTTPWYEPFGITPLESMACGTPVIGSNVGGIKYSVEDGKTGYLVPSSDDNALAQRMFELLSDPSQLLKMKEQAITRANSMFRWSHVASMAAALYERIIFSNGSYTEREEEKIRMVENAFVDASQAFLRTKQLLSFGILQVADTITECFRNKKKLLVCGNGGSASESQHLVAELVGRFEISDRPAFPAIALTADSSFLTAWSNDIGFAYCFARQVQAYGQPGDVLLSFTTTGNSENIIHAIEAARTCGMTSISITGKGGGEVVSRSDLNIIIPSQNTQRIQELHLHVLHTICSIIEKNLFIEEHAQVRSANGLKNPVNGTSNPYVSRNGRNGRHVLNK